MPTSAWVILVASRGAQTQASTMDPRPRAYDPAPTCSFRSGPSPPPNGMQKQQGAPSVFRAQTRAERRAGAGVPGRGPSSWREPEGAGHRGTREAERAAARAALKLAPPLAHDRAPPSPSPKAPSQWASRKGRARKLGTGRGSHARGKGRGRRAALDGQLPAANPPSGSSALVLAGLRSSSLLLSLHPPPSRLTPRRPAPPPLPHSAGKSLLERGGGRSGRRVWSLGAGLTGAGANQR